MGPLVKIMNFEHFKKVNVGSQPVTMTKQSLTKDDQLAVNEIVGLLEQEDVKSIGTIRRYGLAADYLIMIGGAKAELQGDEEGVVNGKEVSRLLKLAIGSIEEITTILKSAKAV